MAYTAITTGEVTSGEPVSTTTQTKIKTNFDDHEARLQLVESSTAASGEILFSVSGRPYVDIDILKSTANMTLTILGVRILVDKAGTAGSLEIDIKKSRAGGAFTSIFTTKPIIGFAAGDDALSSPGTLDGSQSGIIAGDILRLDITSIQTNGLNFIVRIDY